MDINTRISKAKTRLILEHPFIGTVAMNMVFRVSDECPTAMTNGKEVVLNIIQDREEEDEYDFSVPYIRMRRQRYREYNQKHDNIVPSKI